MWQAWVPVLSELFSRMATVSTLQCHEEVPNISSATQGCGKCWVPFSFISSGWALGPEVYLSINPEAHSLSLSPHCAACVSRTHTR